MAGELRAEAGPMSRQGSLFGRDDRGRRFDQRDLDIEATAEGWHEGRPQIRDFGGGLMVMLCPYGHVVGGTQDWAGGWMEARAADPAQRVRCYGTLPEVSVMRGLSPSGEEMEEAMRDTRNDYRHLRAWCNMQGSSAAYTKGQLEQARRDKAPEDAVYWREESGWRTYSEVKNPETRFVMARLLGEIECVP